ncbi:MAG: indole-3-glycerol phosphate synthase TrpC [Chitinivibrionales bacterium]|nr:indole-3-glycerol phosphate synthase TrpC [Chitinivibrionales bacterium]
MLEKIIETKKDEVRRLQKQHDSFTGRTAHCRSLLGSLNNCNHVGIIAEVKKASPSRGVIKKDFEPVSIAKTYEKGNAAAISVLTDEQYFQGSLDYLVAIRNSVALPVLRKDFIIDPIQVKQTAAHNADAMLLIAAALSDTQLEELHSAALEFNIEPLIEIHAIDELDRVMKAEPSLIGINNRDLTTFSVDINTSVTIMKYIPSKVTVISESGIFTQEHAQRVYNAGVKGILVGESLMRADNPVQLLDELNNVGKN